MKKVYSAAKSALDGLLFDGMTIAAGGFGLCGIPENLIQSIKESGVKKTISQVENIGFIPLAQNMGLNTTINIKYLAANFIFKYRE